MKNLILATASVLALGIAGSGVGFAADTYNGSATQAPNATAMPQSTQAQRPAGNAEAQTAPQSVSESQVKQVQEQLKSAGLYKGTADGKMGPETKQALSKFQQQRGLTQTGALDQQTLAALNNNQSGAAMSGSSTVPSGSAGNLNQLTAPTHR